MNYSALSPRSMLGKTLRFFAYRLVPARARLRIRSGPARGKRWIAGAHCPACWLGCYEYEKQRLLEREIRPGDTVFDIGAHRGFFTLVASSLVGPQGRVFAFEPLPLNRTYLQQHLRINRIENVTVTAAAVSDSCGVAAFADGSERNPKCVTAHLAGDGPLQVRTVTLDALVESGELPVPDLLKIDVEGAEMLVLRGARQVLEQARPALVIDTHGREAHTQCTRYLTDLGYQVTTFGDETYVLADGTERYYGELLARKG